ncbi:Lactobacillus shifted protein [Mycena kentingensis (nom. inval.)]|nr:Lactobacillus shifted protein [Mycena kentingensis (nom. inval.)]
MDLQPQPLSAMALVNDIPPTIVHGRKAVCDGGGGPLGHPKIYINLDLPGPRPCGYCGLRFEQAPHHH